MKFIAANWKMNHSFEETDSWLEAFFKNVFMKPDQLKNAEVVLCPPVFMIDYIDAELTDDAFRNLESIMAKEGQRDVEDFSPEELTDILLKYRQLKLGAQDCHHELKGSFTGDISAKMLKDIGCEYVILGHSERRQHHFESDEIVSKKITAALSQNLTPIICVGEGKEVRDQKTHLEFVRNQVLKSIPADVKFEKLIIAYEPVWSIGTGNIPTIAEIDEMSQSIKNLVAEKFPNIAEECLVLYGGSANSKNAQEILSVSAVDGLLVGGASLDADEFFQICSIASKS